MAEHAFDPLPDEHTDDATEAPPIAEDAAPRPHLTLSQDALLVAITQGRWAHPDDSTVLWLNSTFPPAGSEPEALAALLAVHGVAVR